MYFYDEINSFQKKNNQFTSSNFPALKNTLSTCPNITVTEIGVHSKCISSDKVQQENLKWELIVSTNVLVLQFPQGITSN